MTRVSFTLVDGKGRAKYDPNTDEYTWSYDGDDSDVISLLKELENGPVFKGMVTDDPESTSDNEEYSPSEDYESLPWDQQIERLSLYLKREGAEIVYLGE